MRANLFPVLFFRSLKVAMIFWLTFSAISFVASLRLFRNDGPWLDPDWQLLPMILGGVSVLVFLVVVLSETAFILITGKLPRAVFRFFSAFVVPIVLVVWFDAVDDYFSRPGIGLQTILFGALLGAVPGLANLFLGDSKGAFWPKQ